MNARFPLQSLLMALALGLAVRLPLLFAPLQVDEFNTLFEIASRRTATEDRLPGADDPLRLVESAAEVRSRAVLPYGVRSPFPLYSQTLRAVLAPLPLAEWSLRLPSLVAGLGTVAALALLAHLVAGPAAAAAVAFLAAVEPTLVVTSVTARPYAVAGLTIALTFLLHPVILAPARGAALLASAAGHGLALALTGYMNPVLTLVGAAHFVLAVLPFSRPGTADRGRRLRHAGAWAGGSVLAVLLALPLLDYVDRLGRVTGRWRAYLSSPCDWLGSQLRPLFFLEHNASFILLLLACALVWASSRLRRTPEPAAQGARDATAPGRQQRSPDPAALCLLGAACLLVPQAAAILLHQASGHGLFLDRYLFYTAQGGVLLTAGVVAGRPSGAARRETTALCTIALLLFLGIRGVRGENRMTDRFPVIAARAMTTLDDRHLWKSEDILLFHPALIEADLIPDAVPEQDRQVVEEALLAPLSTLYVGAAPRHALALSKTLWCGSASGGCIGRGYELRDRFYGEELAARLGAHPRQWFLGLSKDSPDLLSCFLPWLAHRLDATLTVTIRNLDQPERVLSTVRVPPGPDAWTGLREFEGATGMVLALVERAR